MDHNFSEIENAATTAAIIPDAPKDEIADTDVATNAFIDEVAQELELNLPMKCAFQFDWAGNEEMEQAVIMKIQLGALMLRRAHPWLNFDTLDSIVFHHDYTQALRQVSERAGRECKATAEDSGAGVAMVVHLEDRCVAVLSAGVAIGLLSADTAARDLCIDMVMHELCHVHDYGRKRRLLSHEFLTRKITGMGSHVFAAAEAAWSEYFANRYSNSAHSSPDMHPKMLADVAPSVVHGIHDAILAHRKHHRLSELLALSEQKVRFLFQCFGYAAGRLHANATTLMDIAPESVIALEKAGVADVWQTVHEELSRLAESQEKWASLEELQCLMNAAQLTLARLGLHYSEKDGTVRVDVHLH
jgi:hypothetical protein